MIDADPLSALRSVRSLLRESTVKVGQCFRIPNLLEQVHAERIFRYLSAQQLWGLKLSDGTRLLGVPPEDYKTADWYERKEFAEVAYKAAETGFAFLREELWGFGDQTEPLISRSPEGTLESLRNSDFPSAIASLVGCSSSVLLHLSIERYAPGHFYAFTKGAPEDAEIGFRLDLTPRWAASWGGTLQFLGKTLGVDAAFPPQFNILYVYPLATPRAVSVVAPFAKSSLYSIAGRLHLT